MTHLVFLALTSALMATPALAKPTWNTAVKIVESTPVCGSHCSLKMDCCASEYHLKVLVEVSVEGEVPPQFKATKLKLALTGWLPVDALSLPVQAVLTDAELGALRRDKNSVGYVQTLTKSLGEIAESGPHQIAVQMRLERRTNNWHWMAKECPSSTSLVIRSELIGAALRSDKAPEPVGDNLAFLTVVPPEQGVARGACPR